ncbi:MAG: alpha/beta hydrolase [Noviherbaspirillum sp.]
MEKYTGQEVEIASGQVKITGTLSVTPASAGVVLFAHGSGSGRFSVRNNFVADALHEAGMGTLLIDLLTEEEDRNFETRFDIPLLTQRLADAGAWLAEQQSTRLLPVGLFGASTGAAAALRVAAMPGSRVAVLVSRGGRPDLAGRPALEAVRAPTLFIVGGEDHDVLILNRDAYLLMHCEKRLEVVPGATHLFPEPGRIEDVAMIASSWFSSHFAALRRHG